MLPRRRLANEVPVEEVYESDRMTWLEQQVGALTQQFQEFLATQNQHKQNHNLYDSDEDALVSDDFWEVPR